MTRFLLRAALTLVLLLAGFAGFVAYRFHALSVQRHDPPQFSIAAEVKAADPLLGERIYAVRAGCIDCHGADLSGTVVMENGAMGVIHGANITPFNLGDWSDEDIARAIRYGLRRDGHSLRFMPSFDFAALSKSDTAALIAYLRSVPAVPRPSHANTFGPIARTLSVLGKMPVMFPAHVVDPTQGFAAKPEEGPTFAFGRYLAAACSGCHGEEYRGGPIPGGDPAWPPASAIRLGAEPVWTRDSFTTMINTGVSPVSGQALRPPMPVHLLKQFNDDEVTALWEYLKTLQ